MLVLDILTIVLVGLLIGNEFAVSVFVNPVVWRLDRRVQGEAIAMFARRLGRAMPFWYVASLVLLIVEMVLRWNDEGEASLMVATVVWGAVILLTIFFLVPINNRMMKVGGGSFSEAQATDHRRWDWMHRLRIAALIVAFICFLLGIR